MALVHCASRPAVVFIHQWAVLVMPVTTSHLEGECALLMCVVQDSRMYRQLYSVRNA